MNSDANTFVIQLTPPGRAALASIAVCGTESREIVEQHLHTKRSRPLTDKKIRFGRWKHADGEEVVLCAVAPDRVEIHCHGGSAAVQAILVDLVTAGCVASNADLWVSERFADPMVRQAYHALALARTDRTAAILLDQLNGALSSELHTAIAEIEAGQSEAATRRLDVLLERSEIGIHLTEPWEIVVAGRPNVGKSSLINRIVGYQRSIVFDQPGTTRDVVTATAALDGWPVQISDTAGLRRGGDALEKIGMSAAGKALDSADLRILLFDQSTSWSDEDQRLVDTWPEAVRVENKSDLPAVRAPVPRTVSISAATGANLEELIDTIVGELVGCPPPAGAAIPFASDQLTRIRDAVSSLRRDATDAAIEALRNF